MKTALCLLLLILPVSSIAAEVFRCGEPKGISMWSLQKHAVTPDSFSGVKPVVIVEGDKMTIVWGDSKSAGGAEKVWKAAIFFHSDKTINAIALDDNGAASAAMLYTVDVMRGYLYLSTHKENVALDASAASTFVAKCSK